MLEKVGFNLGIGIANFVTIFNPEIIVLGEGFARRRPAVRAGAPRGGRADASSARDVVRIVPALLGAEAGLIGAGLVGFEALAAAA